MGRWGMPGLSSQGIFLSYRREDAAPSALLLQHLLRERFPHAQVFLDLDSIDGGLPFAQVIADAVSSCGVLVALIGRHWVTIADEEGRRRLDNPGDYVRFEVQTALDRGVRVIPVLVDGARPLRQQELPAGLQELAGLQALELSHARYKYDAGRLFDLVQRVLAAPKAPTASASPAAGSSGTDEDRITWLLVDAQHAAGASTFALMRAPVLAQIAASVARTHRKRAMQLADDAERDAQSVTDPFRKVDTLCEVAAAVAIMDPARAARLAADAAEIARSFTGANSRSNAYRSLVKARAAVDLDQAIRDADYVSIFELEAKVDAVCAVAKALRPANPDRAAQLLADVERLVEEPAGSPGPFVKSDCFITIAEAVWDVDRARAIRLLAAAEDVARGVRHMSGSNDWMQNKALVRIAKVLYTADPSHAVRLLSEAENRAQIDPDDQTKAWILGDIAAAYATIDVDRAERMAESITNKGTKSYALGQIAQTLAASDPDHAERVARSITGDLHRAEALLAVANALASQDL
jgi:hypothetical protein